MFSDIPSDLRYLTYANADHKDYELTGELAMCLLARRS